MSGVKEDIFSICHATLGQVQRLNSFRPWHPMILNFVDDLQAFNENGKADLHCHTVTPTERTELERSFDMLQLGCDESRYVFTTIATFLYVGSSIPREAIVSKGKSWWARLFGSAVGGFVWTQMRHLQLQP